MNFKREVNLVKFVLERVERLCRNKIISEIIPQVNNTLSKQVFVNVM